ncbi:SUMF1/EgtB/PvdO family nonheme iron enzyme, partial [Opitutales bacterium]|nr:SUMF1/EgtB/PvdO family nonheme iron enzyme [Opitutales bacterium]
SFSQIGGSEPLQGTFSTTTTNVSGTLGFLGQASTVSANPATTFTVAGGQGTSPYYNFTDGNGQTPDFGTLLLNRGTTYEFSASGVSTSHPFMIGESYGDMNSSLTSGGPLTGTGGKITLTIPADFNGSLYYFCTNHSAMMQEFTIRQPNHTADLNASVAMEMIWVQPGSFTMGSPTTEAGRQTNETEHNVTLTQGFYLGKYEVTQAQYEAVMKGVTGDQNATPSNWNGYFHRPVESVSWVDIQVFIERLNDQKADSLPEGWAYVLPTEAEWEYACRAGTTTPYSWGVSITTGDANYQDSGYGGPVDVGQYDANPWGFFDMHGNVFERVHDYYVVNLGTDAVTDPRGANSGSRVIKGGAWYRTGDRSRSAYRSANSPDLRSDNVGFRLAYKKIPHVVELNSTVNMEMIWVEPGTFAMGQDGVAGPEHNVTLTKGFYLGKYEVTQAQYKAVMTGNSDGLSATPSNWPNNADRPVEKVSWDDIQKFLTRLNAEQAGNIPAGWSYVLPTEAQWEYACRAGTTTAYSWGDSITADNAHFSSSGYSQTRDVGLYAANPWGFFDMHGNVLEWTADRHGLYNLGAQTDPKGPATGSRRVHRGGSWHDTGTSLRSAGRSHHNPSFSNGYIGFRVGFQIQPDEASPELELFGGADIPHKRDEPWAEPGYGASDVRDGNLTSSVSISGIVDVNTTGTYTLVYSVSDAAGNEANATRTVRVADESADTDGDGFNDYLEALAGSDFNDSNSTPGLDFGLIGYWPLEGNASDRSGNDLDGTAQNGASFQAGAVGQGLYFDGTNDALVLPSFELGGVMTISFWGKIQQFQNWDAIMDFANSSTSENLKINMNDAGSEVREMVFQMKTANGDRYVGEPFWVLNEWVHLALTVDSNATIRLYRSGSLIATESGADFASQISRSQHLFGKSTYNANHTKGMVDEIRFYDRAIQAREVAEIALQGNTAPFDLNASSPLSIAENLPIGTIIGEFIATDPDAWSTITYKLSDSNSSNDNHFFTLDTNGTLKTATTFDYETNASSYTVTVKAKDELNASVDGNFTVTLLDALDALDTQSIAWGQDFSGVGVGQNVDLNASATSGLAVHYSVSDTSVAELAVTNQSSLQAWYKLDETSGDASDSSTNSNTGSLRNVPTYNTGKFGNAITLDGTDDHVRTYGYTGINGTAGRTISLWFKTLIPGKPILQYGDNTPGSLFQLSLNPSGSAMLHLGDTNITSSTTGLADGNWHHLAVSFPSAGKSGAAKLYVDNNLTNGVGSTTINTSSGTDVVIGRAGTAGSRYFNGQIDDVRFYEGEMNSTLIGQLYENGNGDFNRLKIKAAGSVIITATQAGDSNYSPAPSTTLSASFEKSDQTISFGTLPEKSVGEFNFIPTAVASSGLDVTFTSSDSFVAQVQSDGKTIKIRSAGTATITSNQAGNSAYNAATTVTQTLTVGYFNLQANSLPGIRLWLDANNIDGDDTADTITDGTAIIQWIDQSGNNNHPGQATAGNRPTYGAAELNGKGVVNFAATESFELSGDSNIRVIAAVLKQDSSQSAVTKPFGGNPNLTTAAQKFSLGAIDSGSISTTYRIVLWQMVAGDYSIHVDGINKGSSTSSLSPNAFDKVGNDLAGSIAEVVVYDRALSSGARQKLEGYLANKWGLNSSLPSGHTYKNTKPAFGGTQILSFPPLSSTQVGQSVSLNVSSDSGLTTFIFESNDSTVVSFEGNVTDGYTVRGLNTGQVTITATQPGQAPWNSVTATQSFTVLPIPREIFTVTGGQGTFPYYTITDSLGQSVNFSGSKKLISGTTYEFVADNVSGSHPFMIGESYGDTSSSLVSGGPLTGTGGKIILTIPEGHMGDLYYFCTNHSGMIQQFMVHGNAPLTDPNFHDAISLWFDAEENATAIYGHISDWNTSVVTNMSGAFENRYSFNEDITSWDTTSVTNMSNMFFSAQAFAQNVGDWDTSSVTTMSGMFFQNDYFSSDLSSWDTSSVTSMSAMFNESGFSGDISSWDTSLVTDMSTMFERTSFNSDISDWNVTSVTNFTQMFNQATDGMTGSIKGKIHEAFSPNPNWPYNWSEFVNYAPTIIFDDPDKIDPNGKYHIGVDENQTFVMQVAVTDVEGDEIVFSIHSGLDADFFQIDSNSGVIEFKIPPDYEAFEDNRSQNKFDLKMKISDGTNEVIQGVDIWLSDIYEDTDGDGYRDSLEFTAGSDLNDSASTPFNHGLVAWYPFDGNASDMSGNGNHGTVNGATLGLDRFGEENKSYSFDGVDDYIDLGNSSLLNPSESMSISSWIKCSSLKYAPIVERYEAFTGGRSYYLNLNTVDSSHSLGFYTYRESIEDYGQVSGFASYDRLLNLGLTHHVVGTFDLTGGVMLFVDGSLISHNNVDAPIQQSDQKTTVGGLINSAGKFFQGTIDDIRIYERALSTDEVELLYRTESPNHFADLNSSVNLEMIWVEPGTFTMGSDLSEASRYDNETEHNVSLTKGFYLGKYEVTQAQFEAVMTGVIGDLNATPSNWHGYSNRPVEMVSWNDTQVFIDLLNEQEAANLPVGWEYALPTEAQWEFACRAGTNTAYSWGDDINSSHANWNYGSDANQTEDIGQYSPNPWGFFDMHGNVFEWIDDWYGDYTIGSILDPKGPSSGDYKIGRGGSWYDIGRWARSSRRVAYSPDGNSSKIGFRLALRQINEPPKNLNSITALTIAENQPVGTIVGEFNATDPGGGSVTYYLENGENNNSFFTLDTNGTLKTATVFDYEVNASTYTITVQARDELNVTTEGNFTVTLLNVDDTSPILYINGDTNITLEAGGVFTDEGAIWNDSVDGNGTADASGTVDSQVPGIYIITYSFTDAAGNVASTISRTINVVDSTASVISLNGDANITHEAGSVYHDANATWTDMVDGTGVVIGTGEVNASIPGVYELNFDYTDTAGNAAETVSRTVNVVDTTVPVITLNGDSNITHDAGSVYDDENATWLDIVDGGGVINATGEVDVSTIGRYLLAYNYTDANGNSAVTANREVWVFNTAPKDLSSLARLEILENQPIGTLVGEFNATDPNVNSSITYHLVDGESNNSLFTLDSNGILKTAFSFDYETNALIYTITVQAKDEYNATVEGNFTVSLLDVYEDLDGDQIEDYLDPDMDGDGYTNIEEFAYPSNPRDPNSVANATPTNLDFIAPLKVLENKKPGMPVGKLVGGNGSSGVDKFSYSLIAGEGGTHNEWFVLEPTGLLRAAQSFDYESGVARYLIRVGANTPEGELVEQVFSVHLLDDPYENNPYAAEQGTGASVAGESNSSDYQQYGMVDPQAGWTDSNETEHFAGNLGSSDVNMTIDDGLRIYAALTFVENEPVGTLIGQFQAYDRDEWAVLSYTFTNSFGDQDNAWFSLDENGTLRTTRRFDFETEPSEYSVGVRVSDERNTFTEGLFTIYLLDEFEDLDADGIEDHLDDDIDGDGYTNDEETDYGSDPRDPTSLANRAPVDLNVSSLLAVFENQPVGTWVGEVNATDPDGDLISYHLIGGGNNNSFFTLDQNGTLKTATVFDYELNASNYIIVVEARDERNASVSREFTIELLDVDDTKPQIVLLGQAEILHPYRTAFEDPGAEAFDLVDGDLTDEIIVSGLVKSNELGEYELVYRVVDESGNNADPVTRLVVVDDSNFDRTPKHLTSLDWLGVEENKPVGTFVGEFNATDPDEGEMIYSLAVGGV